MLLLRKWYLAPLTLAWFWITLPPNVYGACLIQAVATTKYLDGQKYMHCTLQRSRKMPQKLSHAHMKPHSRYGAASFFCYR